MRGFEVKEANLHLTLSKPKRSPLTRRADAPENDPDMDAT